MSLESSFEHEVSAAELTEFRSVVRSPLGSSAEGASPLHAFVLAHRGFDLTFDKLAVTGDVSRVHVSQEITVHRPLVAGERVTVTTGALGGKPEGAGVRIALRGVIEAEDGTVVASLVTGAMLSGATGPEAFGELPRYPMHRGTGEAVTVTLTIPEGMVPRYAVVAHDENPIHLDPEAAAAAGFPGVIAHGMSVLAVVTEELVDRFAGGDASALKGIGTRFSNPVRPGVPLEVTFQPGENGVVAFTVRTPEGIALKAGWAQLAV
ncbi:MaoC/PaaZ C-terminal domain-containing protein [Actinokineospora spheciospongiae]|uniref:MaoC/PaaZ C-terminal domain-containing protein n=1 Tax=Actinokineospora spheciospongiae TaxID=909613 RepID=UPI000D719B37|nr:MaoC/PaaZ C-terminal domain-containing protein [Actinokineospora spheciospongiae]PWW59457.1 MaoC dehydratase-like protein [Actinokineospora spheciospongiae]